MISKPLDQITEADLTDLVTAGVAERKTLDYKQQLPGGSDAEKREFLADVSSFANTAGGDLIFGVTEVGGLPTGIPGVQIGDPDKEVLRLESIIRDGLEPRIQESTQVVQLANSRHVMIIRVERSGYGPHRVRGDRRFWGRASNGKFELDVTELRNAVLLASSTTDRISAFRAERVAALESGQSPVPLAAGPMLAMHCMPREAFGSRPQYDVLALTQIEPMYSSRVSGWGTRINLDGIICVASGSQTSAYTQVYRNGVIEAVRVGILSTSVRPGLIPGRAYEEAVVGYLPKCLDILKRLGCPPPIFVGLSLIGVRGLKMALPQALLLSIGEGAAIDRDVLMLPDVVVEDLSADPAKLLKPALDLVWNACGISSSLNFDNAGNWRPLNY